MHEVLGFTFSITYNLTPRSGEFEVLGIEKPDLQQIKSAMAALTMWR